MSLTTYVCSPWSDEFRKRAVCSCYRTLKYQKIKYETNIKAVTETSLPLDVCVPNSGATKGELLQIYCWIALFVCFFFFVKICAAKWDTGYIKRNVQGRKAFDLFERMRRAAYARLQIKSSAQTLMHCINMYDRKSYQICAYFQRIFFLRLWRNKY